MECEMRYGVWAMGEEEAQEMCEHYVRVMEEAVSSGGQVDILDIDLGAYREGGTRTPASASAKASSGSTTR
jgi:hypothetical protein